MKALFVTFLTIAVLASSCGNNDRKQSSNPAFEDSGQPIRTGSLDGQWNIENIVVNDTLYVCPSEKNLPQNSYIIFDDGSYSIMTDCNHIHGTYSLKRDSIVMHDVISTEIACENMLVENLLKRVLPDIRTVDFMNDSIVHLNSETSAYIVLSRLKEPLK